MSFTHSRLGQSTTLYVNVDLTSGAFIFIFLFFDCFFVKGGILFCPTNILEFAVLCCHVQFCKFLILSIKSSVQQVRLYFDNEMKYYILDGMPRPPHPNISVGRPIYHKGISYHQTRLSQSNNVPTSNTQEMEVFIKFIFHFQKPVLT